MRIVEINSLKYKLCVQYSTTHLMLLKKIITVCCENHYELHKRTLCEKRETIMLEYVECKVDTALKTFIQYY